GIKAGIAHELRCGREKSDARAKTFTKRSDRGWSGDLRAFAEIPADGGASGAEPQLRRTYNRLRLYLSCFLLTNWRTNWLRLPWVDSLFAILRSGLFHAPGM